MENTFQCFQEQDPKHVPRKESKIDEEFVHQDISGHDIVWCVIGAYLTTLSLPIFSMTSERPFAMNSSIFISVMLSMEWR